MQYNIGTGVMANPTDDQRAIRHALTADQILMIIQFLGLRYRPSSAFELAVFSRRLVLPGGGKALFPRQ